MSLAAHASETKKTFSELILFRVELIAFSFVDLISKQARLAAAVIAFLSFIIAVFVANE